MLKLYSVYRIPIEMYICKSLTFPNAFDTLIFLQFPRLGKAIVLLTRFHVKFWWIRFARGIPCGKPRKPLALEYLFGVVFFCPASTFFSQPRVVRNFQWKKLVLRIFWLIAYGTIPNRMVFWSIWQFNSDSPCSPLLVVILSEQNRVLNDTCPVLNPPPSR